MQKANTDDSTRDAGAQETVTWRLRGGAWGRKGGAGIARQSLVSPSHPGRTGSCLPPASLSLSIQSTCPVDAMPPGDSVWVPWLSCSPPVPFRPFLLTSGTRTRARAQVPQPVHPACCWRRGRGQVGRGQLCKIDSEFQFCLLNKILTDPFLTE